ncbi:hypothetical protein IW245_004707 [Longispora fulva]|uniref:Uncharacterized protein n=1 Tax=Longispora fulva TaxID=619741 RepID=A0A8J7GDF2_9ACTN|nr:hypothetical protein [Longispora fulva]
MDMIEDFGLDIFEPAHDETDAADPAEHAEPE